MKIMGFDSVDKLIDKFNKFDSESNKMFKEALYDGAAVVADRIKSGIESIPVQETKTGKAPWGTSDHPLTGITSVQKNGLMDGFGVSHFRDEGGSLTTSIGFDGYNADGKPNVVIARAVESGSSFRRKHPFVRPAVNAVKGEAEKAMEKKILEKVKEI